MTQVPQDTKCTTIFWWLRLETFRQPCRQRLLRKVNYSHDLSLTQLNGPSKQGNKWQGQHQSVTSSLGLNVMWRKWVILWHCDLSSLFSPAWATEPAHVDNGPQSCKHSSEELRGSTWVVENVLKRFFVAFVDSFHCDLVCAEHLLADALAFSFLNKSG